MGTSTFVETGAVSMKPKFSGESAESNFGTVGESKGFAGDSACVFAPNISIGSDV